MERGTEPVQLVSSVAREVFKKIKETRRPKRKNRTLSHGEDQYVEFEKACRELESFPSEVIDLLSLFKLQLWKITK